MKIAIDKEILALLEQQKDVLHPESIKVIKENLNKLPDNAKEDLLVELQNSAYLKKLVIEYNDQRQLAIDSALGKFRKIEDKIEKKYKEVLKKGEAAKKEEDAKTADESLKELN